MENTEIYNQKNALMIQLIGSSPSWGEAVRRVRKDSGFAQREVAGLLEGKSSQLSSQYQISRIERGILLPHKRCRLVLYKTLDMIDNEIEAIELLVKRTNGRTSHEQPEVDEEFEAEDSTTGGLFPVTVPNPEHPAPPPTINRGVTEMIDSLHEWDGPEAEVSGRAFVSTGIRLPKWMMVKIEAMAVANYRSRNGQIGYILSKWIDDHAED